MSRTWKGSASKFGGVLFVTFLMIVDEPCGTHLLSAVYFELWVTGLIHHILATFYSPL